MAGNDDIKRIRTGSTGRGFACMDPERQGEMVGYVRTTPAKWPQQPQRATGMDWTQVRPDRDTGIYEGSSSRRSR